MERKRIGIEKYKDICPMRDNKNREGKEGKSCGEEKYLTCQDKREEEKNMDKSTSYRSELLRKLGCCFHYNSTHL